MMASNINPDLQKERDTASFNVEEMTNLLEDGAQVGRREMEKKAAAIKDFDNPLDFYHMSRDESYDDGIRRSAAYLKDTKGITDQTSLSQFRRIAFPMDVFPLGLHEGMFLVTLENQLSDEQKKKWLPKVLNYEILGTYAQTELGHGTHLRGLETTATYDPKTEEFVLNSPKLTAAKWWPGALGKTSNMVVLMAQTFSNGINHGMMSFLLQIRDFTTHEPLPGVTVGDIGPKIGYINMDNGFLLLDHVRIPREQMMGKHVEMKKDGTLVRKTTNSKLTYGTMVWVRAGLVYAMGGMSLAATATIATRYSAVRRQSELQPGVREPQVLDYQTQQVKVLPQIALAYSFIIAGKSMMMRYFQVMAQIKEGNSTMLPELHGLSSGMKALSCYTANAGMEQCRLACGGHGYSMSSGIPKVFQQSSPGVTFEGENSVLYLQCARYLMKAYQQANTDKPLDESVAYLSGQHQQRCGLTRECTLKQLMETFKVSAISRIQEAGAKLAKLTGGGMPQYEAWNNTAVQLTKAAQVFAQKIESEANESLAAVMTRMCKLVAVHLILQRGGDFLKNGYMSSGQLSMMQEAQLELLAALRPDAVALVDAFDFTDHGLCSVLGRYDGQVYENLFKWAQSSRLNQTEVHDSFYQYIQPLKQMNSRL